MTWQGTGKVSVETVPDPRIEQPTDAIVRMTSTAICGSDLHLYDVLGMYIDQGDILGHEPMGIVEEVGAEVTHIKPGDRVVIPFNISCGSCWMCSRGFYAQCETTQNKEQGKGASLFGYTKLYGQVPGGQAEYLRVPQAHFGPIKVPDDGRPDEHYLFLSDVLTTSWQAVKYAGVQPGDTVFVTGLGPIGQISARVARHLGAGRVIASDLVPERLAMAERHGIEVLDASKVDVPSAVLDMTGGRGADSVIESVGMEAHGSPVQSAAIKAAGKLPDAVARKAVDTFGLDRMAALTTAFAAVRRAGTVSIIGVYGGQADPMPMMDLFDKGVTLRMGQAHVRRWSDEILPILTGEGDPLGVDDLVTHRLPLEEAPHGYEIFKNKEDGCIKVVLKP
ncbi:glutathione-dependent formaldehyde dehydrogenase [Paractinoplanes deccanensis]|uniref:Glutathione-dependent formaldehyde dehydrogenase n=1 Tax=Paractinoplanes deccanensis TaxID=113561 RepID=A0ABQ3YHP8_9ACTN|nr:glutathione-dependent formaldehyde dehydrogenase [Actinoplanes deccanensis]